MNELLQPGQHLDAHPDPDQLSAFAEHALPAHEQQQTLAHLAVCADCRALVYLAQAAEPVELQIPLVQAARASWFLGWSRWHLAWPAALALACLVVVTVHLRQAAVPPNPVSAPATVAVDQTQAPTIPPPAAPTPQAEIGPTPPQKKPQTTAVTATPAETISVDAISADAVDQIPVASAAPAMAPRALFGSRMLSSAASGGAINGTVTDPAGAVIPRAQVTATNILTGARTKGETSADGRFSISPLPAGTYNVEAVLTGFERLTQENIQVNPAQVAGLNLRLKLGSESTTVSVSSAAPMLDTSNATLGGTIESHVNTSGPLTQSGATRGGPRDQTQAQSQFAAQGVQQTPPPAAPLPPPALAASAAGGVAQGGSGGGGQPNPNQNYIQGGSVSKLQPQSMANVASFGVVGGGSGAALGRLAKPLPQLPSHLAAVSTVANGRQTIALDSAGALFRSDDAGVSWRPVATQWKGRAKTLRMIGAGVPVEVQSLAAAAASDEAAAAPAVEAKAKAAPPVFELTTDSGAVYTSPDGQTWKRK